jgi:hypothetical protein
VSGNYPAGVDDSHPHFNPETCHSCGEVLDEGMCPDPDCEQFQVDTTEDPRDPDEDLHDMADRMEDDEW